MLLHRYAPMGGMDKRLGRIEASGAAYYHLTDRLGSVVGTLDAASGEVAQPSPIRPMARRRREA